jgi:hypothetical protein
VFLFVYTIYLTQEQGCPVIPLGTGFPFRRPLRLTALPWRYSNPPPLFFLLTRGSVVSKALCYKSEGRGFDTRWRGLEVKVEVTIGQSVSQYVLVSSTLVGLGTRYYFLLECCCLKVAVLFLWDALSDERTGLQFAVQSHNGSSRAEPVTILYCLIWDSPNL